MRDTAKKLLRLFARILVATVLLVWAFSQVDFAQFRQVVSSARWECVLGVWLSTAVFFWLQCLTMEMILRKQDCRVGVNTLFGVSCITAFYSLILPGILSTGVKWYILKRLTGKGSQVLSSMLYNQVTLSVVMIVVGLAALVMTNPTQALFPGVRSTWIVPTISGALLVMTVVVSVLLLNRRTGGSVLRLFERVLRWSPGGVRDKGWRLLQRVRRLFQRVLQWLLDSVRGKGLAMLTQIGVFQTAGWRFHFLVAMINAFNTLLIGLLIYYFAARAAHIGVSVGVLLWLCVIIFLLSKVPITVANLGVREVTLVGLLGGYGVGRSEALLMSMILFSSLVFMAALGGVYQLFWWVSRSRGGGGRETEPARGCETVSAEESR